jgi:hypothetical protein
MFVNRLKKTITRFTADISTVLIVLVFFSVFLTILNALFPSGTGLYTIIPSKGSQSKTSLLKQTIRRLWLVQGDHEVDPETDKTLAAVLKSVHNNVKSKRAGAIAWGGAKENMPLYDRDAVQTLNRSAAQIVFNENSVIDMGERSIVVIRQLADDALLGEIRSVVVLLDGELHGNINGSDQKPVHMEVATPSATILSKSLPGTQSKAKFKITLNPDKSSTVTVYQGTAEVLSQGKKVVVNADQSTLVPLYQTPFEPSSLPDTIKLKSPEDSRRYYYHKLPPKIKFTWEEQSSSKKYHFILSKDLLFRNIITEEILVKPELVHGNLKKGNYYWKVKAQAEHGDGAFSEIRRFEVVQDNSPPKLSVHFPPKIVYSESCTVPGKTEPGANVIVDGNPVKTSRTGEFRHELKLQRGVNVIVVEAVDLADNIEFRSQLIHGKF